MILEPYRQERLDHHKIIDNKTTLLCDTKNHKSYEARESGNTIYKNNKPSETM